MKRVGPVRMSTKRPTQSDCLRVLGEQIRQDHGSDCVAAVQAWSSAAESTKRPVEEGAASRNANDAKKAALEAEKARDELHNQIQQIEEKLHPKRARTHDDAGDAHEMLAEVETTVSRQRASKTVAMCKSGLATINRSLAQARTVSCITHVLVWLGGFNIGAAGTLLWQFGIATKGYQILL